MKIKPNHRRLRRKAKQQLRIALQHVLDCYPCGCGCNHVQRRGLGTDWSELGRFERWVTKSEEAG